MKLFTCPRGCSCGGTGWEWVSASDGPNPEPGHYVACRCNPHAAGSPYEPLEYVQDEGGDLVGAKRIIASELDAGGEPF